MLSGDGEAKKAMGEDAGEIARSKSVAAWISACAA